MQIALYARVSSTRHTQTIDQQLTRLQAHVHEHGWTLEERHIYRDDGYSGASLTRPGLDALRDQVVALAEIDLLLVTAPVRLARNYVHQVLLLEGLQRGGCQVEFLEHPVSQDPHDQLLLQIRGAVAEYERTLIAERMRRGRLQKLQAGSLLPWTRAPYGLRTDPNWPRDPRGVRVEAYVAVLLRLCFAHGFHFADLQTLDPKTLRSLIWGEKYVGYPRKRRSISPENRRALQRALDDTLARKEYPPVPLNVIVRTLGVSQYEVYKANPHACRGISARYLTYRQQHTEQQRQNLGEEAGRIVFQLRSQGVSPDLGSVASRLSHAGSLRKPEMRKLVREQCQASEQSDSGTDDPLHEMEA